MRQTFVKKKMKQKELISYLNEMIRSQIERTEAFYELNNEQLSLSESPESWNILQCMEHLNRYAEFYLHEFERVINKARKYNESEVSEMEFKEGYWGKKFTKGMKPDADGKIYNQMKTFKSKNPQKQEANQDSLEKFLEYQERWLLVLGMAKEVNLNKNNCKLTIPLLSMNLGSTLRFVIYHQERHVVQAERVAAVSLA